MICLDAPGEVLFRRKPEASVEWLESRRSQYRELSDVFPHFAVVDVDRPLDVVTKDVVGLITECCEKRRP